jgi:hypothetical protein
MPRKATDTVTEHRITLGDLERTQLKKMVQAEAVKDYGQAAQGIGFIALGAGALIGGTALTMYLAPQLWGMFKELPKDLFDKLVDAATPVLDDTVDWAAKGSPIEHRRMAQELARRRGELDNNITYFCTASSVGYDAEVCTKLNTVSKREYFDDLRAFNDLIDATYNETSATHTLSLRAFIYRGLGDINPDNR